MANLDILIDVFARLNNGDYPDFKSFSLSLKRFVSQMKPFEQARFLFSLRRYYDQFNGINKI